MINEFKKIEQAIDTYRALQAEQIDSFEIGQELPDLALQSREREELTAKLMRKINFFTKMVNKQKPPNSEVMLIQIHESLNHILEQNRVLEAKVRQLRDHIGKSMSQVSRGKQMIGRYRSSVVMSKAPKVISITN
jgi:hypothetical protein